MKFSCCQMAEHSKPMSDHLSDWSDIWPNQAKFL